MSYFDDQEDAWFANDCQGDISDVDPYDEPYYGDEDQPVNPLAGYLPVTLKHNHPIRARHVAGLFEVGAR